MHFIFVGFNNARPPADIGERLAAAGHSLVKSTYSPVNADTHQFRGMSADIAVIVQEGLPMQGSLDYQTFFLKGVAPAVMITSFAGAQRLLDALDNRQRIRD